MDKQTNKVILTYAERQAAETQLQDLRWHANSVQHDRFGSFTSDFRGIMQEIKNLISKAELIAANDLMKAGQELDNLTKRD